VIHVAIEPITSPATDADADGRVEATVPSEIDGAVEDAAADRHNAHTIGLHEEGARAGENEFQRTDDGEAAEKHPGRLPGVSHWRWYSVSGSSGS
jgi:hypothetical protein